MSLNDTLTYTMTVTNAGTVYPLPDYRQLVLNDTHDDVPAISFDYPFTGLNNDQLSGYYPLITVYADGVEYFNRSFYLENPEIDLMRVKDGTASYSGRGVLSRLEATITYPSGGLVTATPTTVGSRDRFFITGSPLGKDVVKTIWDEGTARTGNATSPLTYAGLGATTSDGSAWNVFTTYSGVVACGTDLKSIILKMAQDKFLHFRAQGLEVRFYNPADVPDGINTCSKNKTDRVVLNIGTNVNEAVVKQSIVDTFSTTVVEGANNRLYEKRTSAAETAYSMGRREAYVSKTSLINDASITAYSDALNTQQATIQQEYNVTVFTNAMDGNRAVFASTYNNTAIPDLDYVVGDFVSVQLSNIQTTPTVPVTMRIMSMTYIVGDNGILDRVQIQLGTVFKSREETTQGNISSIETGEVVERTPLSVKGAGTNTSTTSLTYTDTGTVFSLSFVVPKSGRVEVTYGCEAVHSVAGGKAYVGWRMSGTDTVACSDSISWNMVGTVGVRMARSRLVDGLTPGATNTVTMQHQIATAGTGNFNDRVMHIIPCD